MESSRRLSISEEDNVRMAGFLEKKGKMKLMSQWKKYWFVLEKRLLLYYRSETEYTNLSPCRGSLNMGLVSSVRPGPSLGPCLIHIITRTQIVQLKAKNRATQEEWLQALLHSMSLPLVSKPLKTPVPTRSLIGCGCSLDNIPFDDRLKHLGSSENEWTLPRKLDYHKRQMSGTFYGGSLDTVIWSKKMKSIRTPSPNVPKGKVLEKILGFSRESDSMNLVLVRPKGSRLSLNNETEMKFVGNNSEIEEVDEQEEIEVKCKVHDENRNHDLYSVVDKNKKVKKTLSDTELSKAKSSENLEYRKERKKSESPFERIRNVLSRLPKDKILKNKSEVEKKSRLSKQRRQSFLQKVLKKKNYEHRDSESDITDPLYDTIEHIQDQNRKTIPVAFKQEESSDTEKGKEKETDEVHSSDFVKESLYSEIQKPVTGSKVILPAQTMLELRTKLKSRESLEEQEIKLLENDEGEKEFDSKCDHVERKKEKNSAPSLPPRRVSRPVSPWHDVPTNNAPVTSNKKSFFVHQAIVKFNDSIQYPSIEEPRDGNEFSQHTEDELQSESTSFYKKNSFDDFDKLKTLEKKKNDDLSILLEQLTKITVAPLAEPELTDDTSDWLSDSEKIGFEPHFSDPDYDIPRPHHPLNILMSQGNEILPSTEFMGRRDDNSDTGSSFRSMEPDSLEMPEKKSNLTELK